MLYDFRALLHSKYCPSCAAAYRKIHGKALSMQGRQNAPCRWSGLGPHLSPLHGQAAFQGELKVSCLGRW